MLDSHLRFEEGRLGAGFQVVVWPSAVLFRWGHIEQGSNWQEQLAIFLMIGAGGVIVAWLLHRWQNLWFPIMLHIAVNLWWELFSVARSALEVVRGQPANPHDSTRYREHVVMHKAATADCIRSRAACVKVVGRA